MAALDLGAAGSAPAVEAAAAAVPEWGWLLLPLPLLLAAGVARLAVPRGAAGTPAWAAADPARWTAGARALVLFYLVAVVLTHAFAAGAVWQATRVAYEGAPEYFRFAKPLHLFRMSHQHAFGHGTMYLLLGGLFLLTGASERLKVFAIAAAGIGATADLASWWLQAWAGPAYEPLSLGGGLAFSIGFVTMTAGVARAALRTAARPSRKIGSRRR